MTVFKLIRDVRVRLDGFTRLAFCLVAVAAGAYDLELDAGARIGSGDPSALGAASWTATALTGPFAFGTRGAGEASLDIAGDPGVDAVLRGDASYAAGPLVSGLRIDASALRSIETEEESIELSLSAPFTLNGQVLSLSLVPSCGTGFYDDESVNYGAAFSLSYLAGDFVLKPGAGIKRTLYPDDTEVLEFRPSLGFVWYPGIPVTADFTFGWSRSETDTGDVTTGYPLDFSISVVPISWVCLTARFEGTADGSGFASYRTEGGIEFIKYGSRGAAWHLPVSGYFSRAEDGNEFFGLSVMVGYSFGNE